MTICSDTINNYLYILLKYDLRVDYYKDGVAQSYTVTGMTSAIGTYNYYLPSGTSWAVGNYTGLTVTPQNIVAA